MSGPKGAQWLKEGIAQTLGWDEFVVEGVVKAINEAGTQKEVDEIVEDYMGGDERVKGLVTQFINARQQQRSALDPDAAASSSSAATAGPSRSGFARAGGQRLTDASAPPVEQEVDEPEVIDGLKVKRTGKRGKAGGRGAAAGSSSGRPPKLERPVANCLACGKIYDCRGTLTPDITAFLEAGGLCTFCGFRLALHPRERSETRDMRWSDAGDTSAAAGAPELAAAPAATPGRADSSEAAAVAFKDRLVEADRNSARRTTVVDDQSDFFEIDANAWLTPEERVALREREKAIAEAEEARKRRVTVTVDLLGRQVLLADDEADAAEAAAGGCSIGNADAAAAASAATAEEIPQGGGTATAAAASAAASLRISSNPGLTGVRPMFVKPQPKPAAADDGGSGGQARRDGSGGAAVGGGDASKARQVKGGSSMAPEAGRAAGSILKQRQRQKPGPSGRRQGPPRLQHDNLFESAAVVAPA